MDISCIIIRQITVCCQGPGIDNVCVSEDRLHVLHTDRHSIMTTDRWSKQHLWDIFAASEHFVLEGDVFEAGKMGKCKDWSEFDGGQIVMARCLGQSISKNCSSGLQWSVSIPGRNNSELAKGSWVAKTLWYTWRVIQQTRYCCSHFWRS